MWWPQDVGALWGILFGIGLCACIGYQVVYGLAKESLPGSPDAVSRPRAKDELISFTYGLYIRSLGTTCQLVCNLGESSRMDLSFDDASSLIRSIKSACESMNVVKLKIGRLSWTTDARPKPKRPDRLVVKFSGPLGFGHVGLSRREVLSACEDFSERHG
jgi:hypothetical protein